MVRDHRSTGIDSNVLCSFYGPGVKKKKKKLPQGFKNSYNNLEIVLWLFSVLLLAFN